MKTTCWMAGACLALATSPAALAESKLSIGGYIKLDVLYSQFDAGRVPQSIARDFYVPGLTPVGDGESYEVLDFHAKETRLFIKYDTQLESGDKLGAYVETDFLVTGALGGDERITNSYTPGLRRAYLTWNNWLAGQDWTTFQNVAALPEGADFIGPTEGTVFGRQPMVRYTRGGWQMALENPETTVTPLGGGTRLTTNDNRLPDAVLRYNLKFGEAQLSAAGLVRELAIDQEAGTDRRMGYGASVAGKVPVGKDDIRFMLTAGDGIGRYVGINTANDAELDAGGELESVGVIAGFVAYRHLWTPKLRSTFTYSQLSADNDKALSGGTATKASQSWHANLLYSPVTPLTVGVELMHANREVESGDDGDLNRIQFTARYAFNS